MGLGHPWETIEVSHVYVTNEIHCAKAAINENSLLSTKK